MTGSPATVLPPKPKKRFLDLRHPIGCTAAVLLLGVGVYVPWSVLGRGSDRDAFKALHASIARGSSLEAILARVDRVPTRGVRNFVQCTAGQPQAEAGGKIYMFGGASEADSPTPEVRDAARQLVGCREITVTFKSLQGRLAFTVALSEDSHAEGKSAIAAIAG